ncbi:MAG: hypothetical protein CMQ46_02330 [Gammaproteobacteria bacterium]|nr:hypothetical protein [Gammaproteobacteria bacterium]MBJ54086.1 hypothetical protein [Gammaproteobacteria bacterium]
MSSINADVADDDWGMNIASIPAHWSCLDFDAVFENVPLTGLKIPQKEYEQSGRYPVIDQGSELVGGYTNDADRILSLPRPAIVFGDHTKCFKYLSTPFAPGADGIKVLLPKEGILEKYVYHLCKSLRLPDRGYSRHFSFLKKCKFPVPPIDEQKDIVAMIESLLSELDSGIESLKTAREQLKVYRQAVLKHAFEGKLTAQWRAENKDKLESPEQLLARIQQKEPVRDCLSGNTAWSSCSVQEVLASGPTNGRSVKDRPNGFPVLRLTALKSGKIDLAERKSGDWDRSQAEPYLVKEGDFLLSRGNGSKHLVGRGGLVPKNTDEVAFPDTIVRLRVDSTRMLSEFFSLLWDSRFIRDQIEQSARTTAGIYKINQGHIKSFRVPVPSLSEQKVIVNSLEEKLTLTDRQENEIGAALLKAELLRQSILSLAFSGRLTS